MGSTSIISMRLYHGDATDPTTPVTVNDIIGPIDADGNSAIGTDGEWKRLAEYDSVTPDTMGDRVYSVGYVGGKRYIRCAIHVLTANVGLVKVAWCTIAKMFTHAGTCSEKYAIIGEDGGK
jgi:hypothetical protein